MSEYQNYPNPLNPETTITCELPKPADISIIVYNVLGQKAQTLERLVKFGGMYFENWDGTNDSGRSLSSGVYIYVIAIGRFTQSNIMVLVR